MVIAVVESGTGNGTNWLGTTRSLGIKGIDVIKISPKKWYNSKYCSTIICPDQKEEPQNFLTFLITLGKNLFQKSGCKNVLFPSSDDGLIIISKHIEKLKEYFEPVCPGWEVVEKIVDKSKTYELAQKMNLPIPETYTPKDLAEINRIADRISYPCLLKPSHTHLFEPKFKTKLIKIEKRNALRKEGEDLLRQGYKMLIQEEIAGKDDQIYMLTTAVNKDSEPLAIFTCRKIRQWPPHFGVGSFVESVWEPRIIETGIRLLQKMRFYGIASIEFKQDSRTGTFRLLEINGRSHMQNYLATVCGLNLPYILYNDIIGEKQTPLHSYSCNFKLGIKWIQISIDIASMLKKRREGDITIAKWLRSLIGKKTYGIFSLDDPRPFLSEIPNVISQYLKSK